jgi:hypothetical protein
MRKRALWTGAAAGAIAGAGRRVLGFAFGKAIAFTYAVIVSVVANVVFDFVREPPRSGAPDPITAAAAKHADGPAARAALPAPATMTAAAVAPIDTTVPTAASPRTPSENSRPGPGSGGLY